MKEGKKDATELINLEVITNLVGTDVSVPLLVQGKPQTSYEMESQGQEVAIVPPSSHGKGHMGHLCFVCSLFGLGVRLIHSSLSVKSKLHTN